jgi:hypothetical protein
MYNISSNMVTHRFLIFDAQYISINMVTHRLLISIPLTEHFDVQYINQYGDS